MIHHLFNGLAMSLIGACDGFINNSPKSVDYVLLQDYPPGHIDKESAETQKLRHSKKWGVNECISYNYISPDRSLQSEDFK